MKNKRPKDLPFVRVGKVGGAKNAEKFLDTPKNFIARNSHETLNKFDQIVFEFHDIIAPKTPAEMERTIKLIDKINATHTFCLLPLTARICSVFPIFSRAIGINFKVR